MSRLSREAQRVWEFVWMWVLAILICVGAVDVGQRIVHWWRQP